MAIKTAIMVVFIMNPFYFVLTICISYFNQRILINRILLMNNLILIFFGAGIGGVLRYGVSNAIYWVLGRQFPYGTLVVNTTGCFIMGFAFSLILERYTQFAPELRAFILVGLLGGYTTFSAFSLETLGLIENGEWMTAGLNVILSVTLCLFAVWIGLKLGRQ